MDAIMQTISRQRLEIEKKIGRQLLDMEHKIDSRILALTEEVGEIRTHNATKTRLSKVEDELIEVKREFQVSDTTNVGLKCIFPCNILDIYSLHVFRGPKI